MALPNDFNTVTVTGRYIDLAGNAQAGTVTFTSSTLVVDASIPVTIVPVPITATLDSNGAFSIALPATDDPDISPNGYTYKVEERFGGKLLRTYSIIVPYSTVGNIDLSTVAPVQPVTASVQLLPLSGGTMTGALVLSGDPATSLGAATKQYVDTRDLTDGGTVAGPLTINNTGGSGSPPLGLTAGALQTGINLISSYSGGDDDGTGTDSTGRLNLYSFQRANVGSYGENIRHFLMRSDAKTMQAFYLPVKTADKKGGYDATTRDPLSSGVTWKPVVWQGAHYEANDHGSIHGHWELEVADATGALQGRLEIPFIDQSKLSNAVDTTTIGIAYTNIRTNLADLSVRAQNITSGDFTGQNTAFRIGGNNTVNKDILLSISSDMQNSGRRWIIRANTDTEAGSNAGSNFQLLRCADDGSTLGTPLFIQRSDGQITTGATAAKSARLALVWGTSGIQGFSAQPTASPGAAAGFDAVMTAATDRAFQANVTGDANRRLVMYADGKAEWGDGAGSRDTNLYRSAANVLKTDDKLITVIGLGVGNSATATTAVGTLVRKMEVFDASGASLGFVPIYSSIT